MRVRQSRTELCVSLVRDGAEAGVQEIEFLALDELNEITAQGLPLSVLGAARLALKSGDLELLQIDKSIFTAQGCPEGFWEENIALIRGNSAARQVAN